MENRNNKIKISLFFKLVLLFFIIGLVPLLITGFLAFSYLVKQNIFTQESFNRVKEEILISEQEILEKNTIQMIDNKSDDVKKQLELYLSFKGMLATSTLATDKNFENIAVQRFGTTGYTAVHDIFGNSLFHPNEKIKGQNLFDLMAENQEYISLLNESKYQRKGGFYKWPDENGIIREKYMTCQPVNEILVICATIYMDEFLSPTNKLENVVTLNVNSIFMIINDYMKSLLYSYIGTIFALALLIITFTSIFSKKIVEPLLNLTKSAKKIGDGDLEKRIEIKRNDEIGELSEAFEKMRLDLIKSKTSQKLYDLNLEEKVKERTREIRNKIDELQNFHDLTIDRELKMCELKEEIKILKQKHEKKS